MSWFLNRVASKPKIICFGRWKTIFQQNCIAPTIVIQQPNKMFWTPLIGCSAITPIIMAANALLIRCRRRYWKTILIISSLTLPVPPVEHLIFVELQKSHVTPLIRKNISRPARRQVQKPAIQKLVSGLPVARAARQQAAFDLPQREDLLISLQSIYRPTYTPPSGNHYALGFVDLFDQ